ncbi:MAG: hypothetical protein ACKVP5_11280 [Aestuariivirga sp.]
MIVRLTMFAAIAVATAAAAVAAISPAELEAEKPALNFTVIDMNQAWPVYGPITVTPCATEDCSEPET